MSTGHSANPIVRVIRPGVAEKPGSRRQDLLKLLWKGSQRGFGQTESTIAPPGWCEVEALTEKLMEI
jgi:hypothetical protein